jgi:hypothetical protein
MIMSAIFDAPADPKNPVHLVNVETLGAMCGRFPSYEAAEQHLREEGYAEEDFWRGPGRVSFRGGVNC